MWAIKYLTDATMLLLYLLQIMMLAGNSRRRKLRNYKHRHAQRPMSSQHQRLLDVGSF